MAVRLVILVTLQKGLEEEEGQKENDRSQTLRRDRSSAPRLELTINGELWSEVEWSRSRRAWWVQDAAAGISRRPSGWPSA